MISPSPAAALTQATFRSLGYRNYRLYFFGQLLSLNGTWMQSVALAWLVYRLTGSSFMLGLVSFCRLAPVLILGLLGGVLADRYARRSILIGTQAVAMVQALILGLLTLSGGIEPWHIVVLSVLLGVAHSLEIPARHSFIAELVPRAELSNAIGLNSSTFNLARFIGPMLAGVLVALYGEGPVFLFNSASFGAILAGLLLIRIGPLRPSDPNHAPSVRARVGEALRYALSQPRIRAGLVIVAMVSLVTSAITVLMPVFAANLYASGSRGLGFLLSAMGSGAFLGALRVAGRPARADLEKVAGWASLVVGGCALGFASVASIGPALAILAVAGFAHTTAVASTNAAIQMHVEDALRGRVMSLFSMTFIGLMPVGSLVGGLAADGIGPRATVAIVGALCLVGAMGYLALRVRRRGSQ